MFSCWTSALCMPRWYILVDLKIGIYLEGPIFLTQKLVMFPLRYSYIFFAISQVTQGLMPLSICTRKGPIYPWWRMYYQNVVATLILSFCRMNIGGHFMPLDAATPGSMTLAGFFVLETFSKLSGTSTTDLKKYGSCFSAWETLHVFSVNSIQLWSPWVICQNK